jgi:hypothetical protein
VADEREIEVDPARRRSAETAQDRISLHQQDGIEAPGDDEEYGRHASMVTNRDGWSG